MDEREHQAASILRHQIIDKLYRAGILSSSVTAKGYINTEDFGMLPSSTTMKEAFVWNDHQTNSGFESIFFTSSIEIPLQVAQLKFTSRNNTRTRIWLSPRTLLS